MSTIGRKIVNRLKTFNRDLKSGLDKEYTVHMWHRDANGDPVRKTERAPLRKWIAQRLEIPRAYSADEEPRL